ncbi:hypothetical protein [Clostridium sp. AWRP]|uniref:hypothetical protein n=1 Tax=Clostridium sp. AWRP TaxID=2212991 RepID=UPI000FDB4B2C|nr:hypothetical protein [Clostridium sp. AWRP]AZV58336.1 hypothetical protein DMR38_18045 [Clostridium sp. AWRP]
MTAIVIISSFLIGILEGIPLVKKKMWKELSCVVILLIMALFFQVSINLGMATPIDLIEKLFEPIGKTFFNKL